MKQKKNNLPVQRPLPSLRACEAIQKKHYQTGLLRRLAMTMHGALIGRTKNYPLPPATSFRPKHVERQRNMRNGGICNFKKPYTPHRFLHSTHSAGAPCVPVEMTALSPHTQKPLPSLRACEAIRKKHYQTGLFRRLAMTSGCIVLDCFAGSQ